LSAEETNQRKTIATEEREMKAAELREMSDEQLALTLKETTENLFRLKIKAQTEKLEAPSELQKHRRLAARIHTVQRQRQLKQGAAG
jgi:large subunit ribosomal protein L29